MEVFKNLPIWEGWVFSRHSRPGRLVTQGFLNECCQSPVTSAAWPWILPAFSKMFLKPKGPDLGARDAATSPGQALTAQMPDKPR